jgi:hypothetical protein
MFRLSKPNNHANNRDSFVLPSQKKPHSSIFSDPSVKRLDFRAAAWHTLPAHRCRCLIDEEGAEA